MTVYVDPAIHRFCGMLMCHMVSDSEIELHRMALNIGIRREWYQENHYDICKSKRARAVKLGAVEVRSRELIPVIRRMEAKLPAVWCARWMTAFCAVMPFDRRPLLSCPEAVNKLRAWCGNFSGGYLVPEEVKLCRPTCIICRAKLERLHDPS